MATAFEFAATPRLHFGVGKIKLLPSLLESFGKDVLLVRGAKSFDNAMYGKEILEALKLSSFRVRQYEVSREPTPETIDECTENFRNNLPGVIVGVGGGSVLDAAKAISAMLPLNESVVEYLEGVGTKSHPGIKIPFIAVPTTAGTGSEATKNSVISRIGSDGFKKSLRHQRFVSDVAIVDPSLTISCPPHVTAASGMDAFTQLLESYLSINANTITDALALDGLQKISRSLIQAYKNPFDIDARTDMALASYLSGVTLANAGLGLVHGYASSVGGLYDIAHGNICSRMMWGANLVTVRKLRSTQDDFSLTKYATVGKIFSRQSHKSQEYHIDYLLEYISACTSEMKIPRLSGGGVTSAALKHIAQATDNKYNPVGLEVEERIEVLEYAL